MKIEKTVLTITDHSSEVKVVVFYENGRQEEKIVEDFKILDALRTSHESTYTPIGKIPDGYIDASVGTRPGCFNVCIRVPAGVRCISYYDDDYFIPFPECIFFFKYEDGIKEGNSYVFAKRSNSNELCQYPFANVYGDGKICWGSTKCMPIESMYEVKNHIGLFFGSKTNNDLYRPGSSVIFKEEFINQRGLFEFLKTEETFPDELLIGKGEQLETAVRKWLQK